MLRLSWSAFVLITFCMIFSIFIANVVNLFNIEENLVTKPKFDGITYQRREQLKLNDDSDHLMWFLQISDIHISIFGDEKRISQFKEFAETTIDTIKPSVVLASGDLTDAKDSDFLGSRQYLREWRIYKSILDESGAAKKTLWMDIRGNHDNFNIPSVDSDVNYFRHYSVQGGQHKRSYLKQVQKGSAKYSFIAIDACLEPGPKRPFNFIGYLSVNDTNDIIDLANQARKNGGNYTIWFGHYPTSCIISAGAGSSGLRNLLGEYEEGFAYLCGHLHTLGGIVPRMYTLQHKGFLELELGDWKVTRRYRLAAIDHGLFSFLDVVHNEWPIVLITNPKNALFNIPGREDPHLQIDSTHIRLLSFSPLGIENCSIRLDEKQWLTCKETTSNLFVAEWNPRNYLNGLRQIEVVVFDKLGRKKHISQQFSLDGTRLSFSLMERFILMTDVSVVFRFFFVISLLICIVPLLAFRLWHILVIYGKCKRPQIRKDFSCVRRFWILSTVNRLMIPIVMYCIYLTFGPWAISEIIDGYFGIIFSWGIYINGGYIPCTLILLYGFFQLTFAQLPLIFIYAKYLETRYYGYIGKPEKINKKATWISAHVPFIIIIGVEIILASLVWYSYGIIAFVLAPFRTWSVLLNIFLWYTTKNIPYEYLRSAAEVWRTS